VSLERALELAERGRETTRPNPVVGAVVVRAGEVVGEGWHERKGGPHAEIAALEAAGERARGAVLYVTLEPCRAFGSTPPCTQAVLDAEVARVVAASLDPNPAAGGGLEELRAAGVDVELADGDLALRARQQNEAWRTWISEGRPFVTYKAAITLDGRVTFPGSRWVTGEESRRRVHELRAASDAVAVGMRTVRADDPRLDARDVDATRQRPASRGVRARAPVRAARGRARPPRRARRSIAPPRGRADARDCLPPRGLDRQAPVVRHAAPFRKRPALPG
jgi:diaminohydroxyphosphoribosylaminopyrimidine deaminase / 5-amino-6-(5-phosphoribosylamino)uracil reductase